MAVLVHRRFAHSRPAVASAARSGLPPAPGRRLGSTSRLALAFAAFFFVLVPFSVAILSSLSSIDRDTRGIAHARDLESAVAELKVAALRYSLSVHAHLQSPGAATRVLAQRQADLVEAQLEEDAQRPQDDARRDLASRALPLWRELLLLGEGLLVSPGGASQEQRARRFSERHRAMEALLAQGARDGAAAGIADRQDDLLDDLHSTRGMAMLLLVGGGLSALVAGLIMFGGVYGAERRMRRSGELLKVTLDSIDDAVITTDTAGQVTDLNPRAASLLGQTRDEAIGRGLNEMLGDAGGGSETGREAGARKPPVDDVVGRALRGEAADASQPSAALLRCGGGERLVDRSAAPVRDDRGEVVGAVLVVRDLGERRRERAALKAASGERRETERRRNEFLAMLAHELRNPLAPLTNALGLLRLKQARDEGESRAAVEMMERQVAQLVRVVDDLLDMSRITRGRIELRKAPMSLAPVVRQALEAVRPSCDVLKHAVSLSTPGAPPWVEADAARVAQIVGNLLNNACKFTQRGGRIALVLEAVDGCAVLRVRDNGIGIRPEHRERVFEPFTQLPDASTRAGGGIGVGLSLARRLAELHGGSLELHSEGPGRGSEFTLRLPRIGEPQAQARADAPSGRASPARADPPLPSGARRILVVDDNADSAESMAWLMKIAGHEARVAHDGPAALDLFARWTPDVILLDIGLPGLSGLEVARRIRAMPQGEAVMLVAITGWGQPEDRRQSEAAGFDAHLVKPADPASLDAILAQAASH